jgi:tRNA-specific adenosine deaminase 3
MRLAIDEAQKSKAQGNRGIGCVVLDASGRVVASAGDATTTEQCLRHAAIVCIDKVAEKQKAELENQSTNTTCYTTVAVLTPFVDGEEVDYLCTGHTAVLTREPCVMCSMALLHARISRVFYGTESPTSGGLGSVFRIHCHAPLNHHFHVYKGLEVDVCNQLNT